MIMPDLNWLEWIGVVSLAIHGTLGACLTFIWLIAGLVDYTDFRKALTGYYWEKLKRKNPRVGGQ